MLEDPIPSGAEQLENVGNMNLNYTELGWTDWYSSREFRDRRTVFFFDYFDGDVTLQYAMRVQVPGEFVVAPARVELMYEPSTYANTATAGSRSSIGPQTGTDKTEKQMFSKSIIAILSAARLLFKNRRALVLMLAAYAVCSLPFTCS